MTFRNFCCDKETAKSGIKKVLMIIGFAILGAGLIVLMGFVIMWLWNWLMPMIFNLPQLNYWQAVGVFILSKIIFGGFGGGSSNESGHKSKKRKKDTIRGHIKSEFEKEFDKEFDKEYDKEFGNKENPNEDYDELYEKWWEQKGESSFQDYIKNRAESENKD